MALHPDDIREDWFLVVWHRQAVLALVEENVEALQHAAQV